MRGYHNLPEETAAIFTDDGWFRTGDIGELDADGFLKITDRKKDLVKTSGGKYIAPSHIEGLFKSIYPFTSQALVIGHSRNYCTMLVTLDPEAHRRLGRRHTAWQASPTPKSSPRPRRRSWSPATSRSSTASSTAGRPSRSSPSCPAT